MVVSTPMRNPPTMTATAPMMAPMAEYEAAGCFVRAIKTKNGTSRIAMRAMPIAVCLASTLRSGGFGPTGSFDMCAISGLLAPPRSAQSPCVEGIDGGDCSARLPAVRGRLGGGDVVGACQRLVHAEPFRRSVGRPKGSKGAVL